MVKGMPPLIRDLQRRHNAKVQAVTHSISQHDITYSRPAEYPNAAIIHSYCYCNIYNKVKLF